MQVRVPVIKLKACLDDGLEWAECKESQLGPIAWG